MQTIFSTKTFYNLQAQAQEKGPPYLTGYKHFAPWGMPNSSPGTTVFELQINIPNFSVDEGMYIVITCFSQFTSSKWQVKVTV